MSVDNPYDDGTDAEKPPVGESLDSDLEHVREVLLIALSDVDEDSELTNEEFADEYHEFAREIDDMVDNPRVAIMGCWRFLLGIAQTLE